MTLSRVASLLIVFIASMIILVNAKSMLIPFVLAILLWILVREVNQVIDKVAFIRKKFPSWIKSTITSVILLGILGLIFQVLIRSIRNLSTSYRSYEQNVVGITQKINEHLNIDIHDIVSDKLATFNFGKLFGVLLNSLTDILGSTFMILIYALFIFLEETNFHHKLKVVFKDESSYKKVMETLERIENSITQYLGLKVLVSLLTGILSYVALLFIGIDSPVFWAFLIFLLNFIPTIGSLIATIFPVLFSLLQFGEFLPGLWVIIFVGSIQVAVGNIIEPRVMGNSLNISSLVAIMALVFWGSIWGVTGMLLSVPITVILVIILSQFESTRVVAIMLSKDGKIVEPD